MTVILSPGEVRALAPLLDRLQELQLDATTRAAVTVVLGELRRAEAAGVYGRRVLVEVYRADGEESAELVRAMAVPP